MPPVLVVRFQEVLDTHVIGRVEQMDPRLGGFGHGGTCGFDGFLFYADGRAYLPTAEGVGGSNCTLREMRLSEIGGVIDSLAKIVREHIPEPANPRLAVKLYVQGFKDRIVLVQHGAMPEETETERVRRTSERCGLVFETDRPTLVLSKHTSSDNIHCVGSNLRADEYAQEAIRLFCEWKKAGAAEHRVEQEKDAAGILTVRFY